MRPFTYFRSRQSLKDAASGIVGGSPGAAEYVLTRIVDHLRERDEPVPQASAVIESQWLLLGLAYNLVHRAISNTLEPPRQQQFMDEYEKWLEVLVTEMINEGTPNRATLVGELSSFIRSVHLDLADYPMPSSGQRPAGTLFWEVGKLISLKLGAGLDPSLILFVSTQATAMAELLTSTVREQVPHIRW